MEVNGKDHHNLHGLDSVDGGVMNKAITTQRNHKASLRYINSLNAEVHSTGETDKNTAIFWPKVYVAQSYINVPPPL